MIISTVAEKQLTNAVSFHDESTQQTINRRKGP